LLTEVIMPKLGLTMEEGSVQSWRKATGALVQQGEALVDIETDKTVVEVEAPATGYLRTILVPEKTMVAIGTPIALISSTADEPLPQPAPSPAATLAGSHASQPAVSAPTSIREGSAVQASPTDGLRTRASPAARRRAKELNVDLARVKGSGPDGLIGVGDVEKAASEKTVAGAGVVPLTRMRRGIARAMVLSHQTVPVFVLRKKARVAGLLQAQRAHKARSHDSGGVDLTVTDMLLHAVAQTLSRHPSVNASFVGDPADPAAHIVLHPAVNLGLAVATESGLVVPVIADAAHLSLQEIASRRVDLVQRARSDRLRADEMSGGTFSVSNLGGMGIDSFTAIINAPEAAILAVGRIIEEPVVDAGVASIAPTMELTLTADHRVIDGALGAAFLVDLVTTIEQALAWTSA
jgi:pyruvate dehydrogenase E2 component (dihydrolipoamide acetyltransferase)